MRYTVIDGRSYEVRECAECPFRDMGDGGWGAHCTHPLVDHGPVAPLKIDCGDDVAEGCPLEEVQEHKPCPFCGSTNLSEHYVDDEGEDLEEWMMEEANADARSDGWAGYESWEEFLDANTHIYMVMCDDCLASMYADGNIKNTWEKWNRRV